MAMAEALQARDRAGEGPMERTMRSDKVRRHAHEDVVARLNEMARAIEAGQELPEHAAGTVDVAAAVIEQHGELLNRVKAAIGPSLVAAARAEAGERSHRKQVKRAVRDYLRSREPALAGCSQN